MPTTTMMSPIGGLRVRVDDDGRLTQIDLIGAGADAHLATDDGATADATVAPVVSALERYFAGDLGAVDDLDVAPERGTDFQRAVWAALRRIPPGETVSYADIAAAVGRPSAYRAVGSANGANPIPIVVPCHRVVNADGAIGGYALGLDVKRWLLSHEHVEDQREVCQTTGASGSSEYAQ